MSRCLVLSLKLPALVLTALVAGATAEAAKRQPPQFEPDVEATDSLALNGNTWTLTDPEYTIHLRRVNARERLNYIARVTGLEIDPFAAPEDQPERYMSFLLLIENSGEAELQFNPIHSWLMTNKKKVEYPLSLSDLSFSYRVVGRDFPPAYERVGPALLQRPQAIKPGETVTGLLVYHVVEPVTKRFHVDVELTLANGYGVSFAAPYRRRKAH